MDWPTSDVEQNVNHLLQAVMRVTGNTAEAQAEAKRTGNSKPGMFASFLHYNFD
jgi:hypothetical protein